MLFILSFGCYRCTVILTGMNRVTQRKACLNNILSTTDPTQTDLRCNVGLPGEMMATDCLNHYTAVNTSWLVYSYVVQLRGVSGK
jgi:hypothetical protein